MGDDGRDKDHRCHLNRQLRFGAQGGEHHVGAFVVLVVGNAVEPDDQKSAEGKRQRHPDEIGAERGHRLNTVDKCHADESHNAAGENGKERPSNQQPHVGQDVDTAVQQLSFPAIVQRVVRFHKNHLLILTKTVLLEAGTFRRTVSCL